MIRVFLYGQPEQMQVFRQMLKKSDEISVVGTTDKEQEVLDELRRKKADVLLTYVDESPALYRTTQQVYMLCPQCINFALAPKALCESASAKMVQNGIHYIYEDSLDESELISYLQNACTVEASRRSALEDGSSELTSSQVICFYGPKDGLGKSTFLMSYAVELARRRQRVIIVDADLRFGDIHLLAKIENKETMAEMLQERSSPTIDIIRQYISYHRSGVNILCAPRNVEYAEKIQAKQIETIISALRPYYDYILLDTASGFDEIAYTCCEQSNKVYMGVRPDISSLNHAKMILSLLESLGHKDKIRLLFFELPKRGEIDLAKTEQVLGVSAEYAVPYDNKAAVQALNQGEPVASMFPRSALAKACRNAAEQTLEKPEKRKKK